MKTFVFALCCMALVAAGPTFLDEWKQYKNQHNLSFQNEVEDTFRFKIFVDSLRKIRMHNQEYEAGKKTYKMGLNRFSHLLPSEFAETMLMKPTKTEESAKEVTAIKVEGEVPDTMDWRTKGAVTPIKDQGACGSCWAFSATGVIEAANYLKTGNLISLSEKNLMDCCWSYGNLGCSGGDKVSAMQCVVDEGGVDTEESYPYEAQNGRCKFDADNVGAVISGYKRTVKGDEEDLKNAVATVGPIAVSIYVVDSFQRYAGGVYTEESCPTETSNHAVLAVGYGTDEATGLDYWLVKNSWGQSYGEEGYIKMVRNVNNICGIANKAAYPTF